MTQNPVLIFRPKNNKMLKVFFIAIVFVVVGIGLVYSGKNIEGWVGIIIFGLMSVASLISFLPGSTYLRLTEKGVEIRSMYRSWFIDWNEIRQFGYGSIKGAEMIVYELNPDSPKKGKAWTKINSSLAGADGGFDTLGHSAEEMVNVLNEWKEKYAGKRHNK